MAPISGPGYRLRPPRWLPNALSACRIGLVPSWVCFADGYRSSVAHGDSDADLRIAALAVLLSIGLTDVLDGFIARRFSLRTNVGAIVDAVADKLAQVVIYAYLAFLGTPAFARIPIWFIGLLIARDFLLGLGLLVLWLRRGRPHAQHLWHGKLASVLLFSILVWVGTDKFREGVIYAVGLVSLVVVISALEYLRVGWRQLSEIPEGTKI